MPQKIKTSIGLDAGLLSRIDAVASSLGVPRSEVISRGCELLVGESAAGPMVECGRVLAPPSRAASAVSMLLPDSDEWGPVEVVVRVTAGQFDAWRRCVGGGDAGPQTAELASMLAFRTRWKGGAMEEAR